MQREPEEYVDGTSLYQYARSTPLVLTDPMGLVPNPSDRHLGDIKMFWKRFNKKYAKNFRNLAKKRNSFKVPGVVEDYLEPYVMDKAFLGLWAMRDTFDPGGHDDGWNMFFYTCKCGWIDAGHFFANAMYARLSKMILNDLGFGKPSSLARDVVFGASHFVEVGQLAAGLHTRAVNRVRARRGLKPLPNGWGESAWTIEDLPSNWYGANFGATMKGFGRFNPNELRRIGLIGAAAGLPGIVVSQWLINRKLRGIGRPIANDFVRFLRECAVVPLNNVSKTGRRAKTLLRRDATAYGNSVRRFTPFTWRPGLARHPYAWNFSKHWKKTVSHDLLCDENGCPINRKKG